MSETQGITLPTLAAVSKLPGACFWRQNSGNFRTIDGKRIVRATSVPGIADIMGCYLARAVAIETKIATGKLSESQINFRANWIASGGIYIIARSPQEALSQLKAAFE